MYVALAFEYSAIPSANLRLPRASRRLPHLPRPARGLPRSVRGTSRRASAVRSSQSSPIQNRPPFFSHTSARFAHSCPTITFDFNSLRALRANHPGGRSVSPLLPLNFPLSTVTNSNDSHTYRYPARKSNHSHTCKKHRGGGLASLLCPFAKAQAMCHPHAPQRARYGLLS